MKTESSISPQQIVIEVSGDKTEVVLCENIALIDRDGEAIYQYDTYRVSARNRTGLLRDVEMHFADWITYAKGETSKADLTIANRSDIVDKLKSAVHDNKTYLARTSLTVAQNTAQIQRLSRQNTRLIRYLLQMFDRAE